MHRLLLVLLLPALSFAQTAPSNVFDYDASQPLNVEGRSVQEVQHGFVHHISYASPKGGRVPAYLVVPRGQAPFPAVIFMHWGQGDRSEFLSDALFLARSGVLSLMIDAPHNRPDFSGARFLADPEKERDAYSQLVVDLRRAVDLLESRKDVDAKRIVYVGHSLGATWGGALAGVEKRIRGFALMGGLPTLGDFSGDDAISQFARQAFSPEHLEKYSQVMSDISPEKFIGQAAPAAILFQFARWDRYISEAAAERYAAAASRPKTVRWYLTSHEFNDLDSRRDRMEWLSQQLEIESQMRKVR